MFYLTPWEWRRPKNYHEMDFAEAMKCWSRNCPGSHWDSCTACGWYLGGQCQHPDHPKRRVKKRKA